MRSGLGPGVKSTQPCADVCKWEGACCFSRLTWPTPRGRQGTLDSPQGRIAQPFYSMTWRCGSFLDSFSVQERLLALRAKCYLQDDFLQSSANINQFASGNTEKFLNQEVASARASPVSVEWLRNIKVYSLKLPIKEDAFKKNHYHLRMSHSLADFLALEFLFMESSPEFCLFQLWSILMGHWAPGRSENGLAIN